MKTLPADGCFLGESCGLCFTRRIDRLDVKPLTGNQWGRLVGPKTRRSKDEEKSDPCVTH